MMSKEFETIEKLRDGFGFGTEEKKEEINKLFHGLTADDQRNFLEVIYSIHLIGTCLNQPEDFTDWYGLKDLDEDMVATAIDNVCFECADCGWWCDISESNDGRLGTICNDCYSDDYDEEDEEEFCGYDDEEDEE